MATRRSSIPNMFPEGESQGLYHTADASLWFFHAVARYVDTSHDQLTLAQLYPTLTDIVDHHVRGTRFGIHVDPRDGLLIQGANERRRRLDQARYGPAFAGPFSLAPRLTGGDIGNRPE